MSPQPPLQQPPPPREPASDARKRIKLASLLSTAAEIEHMLLCRYMFAAFSMKREISEGGVTWMQLEKMRGWAATCLLISRQEMEHLGLVCNLLTAIGEAPHMSRPLFPAEKVLPPAVPYNLQKFGKTFLADSVLFEIPKQLSPADQAFLAAHIPNLGASEHGTILELYNEASKIIGEVDEKELFIGPPGRQLTVPDILPVSVAGVPSPRSLYDVTLQAVTNRKSALAVIEQIITEGEGATTDSPTCHFNLFMKIFRELVDELAKDPAFEPARNVLINPNYSKPKGGGLLLTLNMLTEPTTIRVAKLFDLVYETLVQMLARYWSQSDQSSAETAELERVLFFPLMTMVVRPLGEMLTQMPAYEVHGPAMAGAPFQVGREISLLPHRDAAWRIFLDQLQEAHREAAELSVQPGMPALLKARFEMMTENLHRISSDFKAKMFPEKA